MKQAVLPLFYSISVLSIVHTQRKYDMLQCNTVVSTHLSFQYKFTTPNKEYMFFLETIENTELYIRFQLKSSSISNVELDILY